MEEMSLLPERKRLYQNPDFLFPLLLVVLGILFFIDPLISTKNFYFRDLLNFHLPLRKVMFESYANGHFPLWNPRVYLGQPMLANPNYMALYPTNLLNLIFPFAYAFKLHLIIHAILGGIGLYFLLRRWEIRPIAALGGSIAYQFSGTVISLLNLYNIAPCPALLPWIGWAFLGCLQKAGKRRILLFGALFGLQVMLLEPLMMQCVLWLMAGIAAVYLIEGQQKRESLKTLTKVLFWGILFAAGIAAIQILPSLEMLRHSVRGGGYRADILSYWSMHPIDLLNLLIPNLFGKLYDLGGALFWGEKFHSDREPYFISLFMGASVLFLAMLSSFSIRKRLTYVFASLSVIGVVLALGKFGGVYLWLGKWIPVFRFGRYSVKYMLLVTVAVCILTALGLETVLDRLSSYHARKRTAIAILAALLTTGVLLIGFSFYVSTHYPEVQRVITSWINKDQLKAKDINGIIAQLAQSFRWAGLFSLITAVLIASARVRDIRWAGALLVLTLGAEITSQNLGLSPLMSGADFDYVSDVDRYVSPRPDTGLNRVFHVEHGFNLPVRQIWAPNRSVAWVYLVVRRSGQPIFGVVNGIQYSMARSVDDLNTKESNQIFWTSIKLKAEEYVELLGRLNTTTILTMGEMDSPQVSFEKSFYTGSDRKLSMYKIKNAMPRVYYAPNAHWAESSEKALKALLDPNFPYENTVILEGPGTPDVKSKSAGRVRVLNYENEFVRCEVESDGKGYLVLLDSFYPGWRATIDGSPSEIRRANYGFRAIEMPAGKHLVEFRYRPVSFYLGFLTTAFTLFIGAIFWFIDRRTPADMLNRNLDIADKPVSEPVA